MYKDPASTQNSDWTATHKEQQLWKASRAHLGYFSHTVEQNKAE